MADPNLDSSCLGNEKIEKYIDAVDKKLSEGKGRWGDLPSGLRDDFRKTLHNTKINCLTKQDQDCKDGVLGRVRNSEIYLCPSANESTLLHEIVHATGGDELDSEAIENHLYPFRGSSPDGGDIQKFIDKDKPCTYMEGDRMLLVSRFVVWDPKSGALWVQDGTRANPKKGKKLKSEFKLDSSDLDQLKKKPPVGCGMEKAQKCGAPCKDFKTYGLCDRKVYQAPCYQHRSAV